MANTIVSPRFSEEEISEMDECIKLGDGRCRSDLARKAVLFYIRSKKERAANERK